jgi:hypothetical protein
MMRGQISRIVEFFAATTGTSGAGAEAGAP